MEENWDQIIKALENSSFKWRTVRGVAKETGIAEDEVITLLDSHQDEIIRSSIPSHLGEALYTTKKHYREFSTVWDRIKNGVLVKVT